MARDWIVHFPRGESWASRLLAARDAGRIDGELMWELLLAHADAPLEPDVAALLEHLPDAAANPVPAHHSTDTFVLLDDAAGAA